MANIASGKVNSNPKNLVTFKNSNGTFLLFRANDNVNGEELRTVLNP